MKNIYLIKTELEGVSYYKIGITYRTPEKRLKELQTGNAAKMMLINSYQTKFGNLFETTLHRTYISEKGLGEWFLLSDKQIEEFITTCEKLEKNLDCISQNNTYWEKKMRK